MVQVSSLPNWTNPVQIRIRDGRVEIRNTVRMGGLSQSFYVVDRDDDDPDFWIEIHASKP